jgi:hypothetical protein
MAITGGGSDYGGGGSTGFNCRISPADEVAVIENLLDRIKDLEADVARLKSGVVEANQLSDLSQQVGWVTGVTYMGTEGWTRTAAGTLIPPAGWSLSGAGILMSDGTPYQGVVMDENGVLQFGWMQDGTMGGARVTAWDAAAAGGGALDYARVEYNNGTPSAGNVSTFRGTSLTSNTLSSTQLVVNVTTAGLYAVAAQARVVKIGGTNIRTNIYISASNDPTYDTPEELYESSVSSNLDGSASGIARYIYFSAAGTITAALRLDTGVSTLCLRLNIVRLSG